MSDFDLTAYLDRIGIAPVPVTLQGLQELQRAQLRAIPFESFEPYLGRLPDLDMNALQAKIVRGGRGGYCFELNALLGAALEALGFSVRRSLARVRKGLPKGGPRSHLMMQVTLNEGLFLADAGYGGPGALLPLRLDAEAEQEAPNGTYRVWRDDATGETVIDKRTEQGWFPLFGFDDAHVGEMDVGAANYICTHWDAMPFPNHLMLAGFDGDTRIGAFDRAVTREGPAGVEKSEISDFREFARLVTEELALNVDDDTLRRAWQRLEANG